MVWNEDILDITVGLIEFILMCSHRRQLAFSVGLTDSGYVGPFQTEITLVYEKVFTNIGNGYDPNSGTAYADNTTDETYTVTILQVHSHSNTSTTQIEV